MKIYFKINFREAVLQKLFTFREWLDSPQVGGKNEADETFCTDFNISPQKKPLNMSLCFNIRSQKSLRFVTTADDLRGKGLALVFFSKYSTMFGKRPCNACNDVLIQRCVFTNCCNHIHARHKSITTYKHDELHKRNKDAFSYIVFRLKANTAHVWSQFDVLYLQPFPFLKKKYTAVIFKQDSISRTKQMSNMKNLRSLLENKNCEPFPDRFAQILDGWHGGSTHYV